MALTTIKGFTCFSTRLGNRELVFTAYPHESSFSIPIQRIEEISWNNDDDEDEIIVAYTPGQFVSINGVIGGKQLHDRLRKAMNKYSKIHPESAWTIR